jgi:hypothetical protein
MDPAPRSDTGEMPTTRRRFADIRPAARRFALCGALALAAAVPASAVAAQARAAHGTITGKITYLSPSALTVQTAGKPVGMVKALIATANAISARDYPYVYGGGHAQAGVASIGIKGPGYNGHRKGYDCSGSVAAVLAGAGLWQPGSPVPNDAGVIAQLRQEHLIAAGAGTAPTEVTLYDDPGVHIFMNIDGRFFGTSDGGGGNSKGGPTWLYDGAPDASTHTYKRYHLLPSVLADKTDSGQSFAFQIGAAGIGSAAAPQVGEKVRVTYGEARNGAMLLEGLEPLSSAPAS